MNDDEPTEPILRASAYLDGELDAAEMAQAEADPALMAEVGRLRALQDEVRDVDTPTHAAREAAIAAALAEFAVQQRPANVVPVRPRPAYTPWLSVAAAIVVIGLLGVVIARASSSSNNNDTAAVEQTLASKLSPNDAASADAATTDLRAAATTVPTADAFDAAAAESASGLALEAAAPTAAAGGAPAEASIADQPVAPAFDPSVPIADDDALGVIGRQLLDQLAAGTLGDLPQSACNDQAAPRVALADALLIVTDTTKAVLIAGDPTTRETFALDPETCAVIATGR